MFATCGLMVQDLLAAKRDLKLRGFLKKISSYHVMILDDIGYVQYSRDEMEVLFALLAERYERGSVVLTSNLAFSGWETIFKDPMTTAAAIDRLVHHSVILELNVSSYRAEQAKKSRQERVGPRQSQQGGVTGSKHGYRRVREGIQDDRNRSGLYTILEAGILVVVRREI